MAQDNNSMPADAKEAYEAYKAYKAYKASRQVAAVAPQPGQAPVAKSPVQDQQDTAKAHATDGSKGFVGGIMDAWKNPQNYTDPESAKAYKQRFDELPGDSARLYGTMAATLAAPESAIGRVALNAGTSGLSRYLQPGGDLKSAGQDALIAGGLSTAGEGLANFLTKSADKGMQYATGMRKYTPGVGNDLVDQGIVGTKGMMANQVENALPGAEQNVQNAVSQIPGKFSTDPLKQAVSQVGNKFKLPSGEVPGNVQPYMDKVSEAANSVGGLGEGAATDLATGATGGGQVSPQDMLHLKRQGDWLGYTASGTPATSLEAELGSAQADKARQVLSEASGGSSADALAKERSLILAKKALTRPESIHSSPISSAIWGRIPGSSLATSLLAQGAQKSTQAGRALGPTALQELMSTIDDNR